MSLVEDLNLIYSYKSDIKTAIEGKGVDMSGTPLSGYASKINEIQGDPVTEELTVTANGVYTPGEGVDGYNKVTVDVPQEVSGYTTDDIADTNKIKGVVSGSISSTIRTGAFWGISTFNTVSFPNATGIGRYTFAGTRLQNVTFPNVVNIYDFAFQSCSLTSASFPELVNVWGSAFNSCLYLKSIYAPNLKNIETCGFSTCTALSYIDFPVISSIGVYAFFLVINYPM